MFDREKKHCVFWSKNEVRVRKLTYKITCTPVHGLQIAMKSSQTGKNHLQMMNTNVCTVLLHEKNTFVMYTKNPLPMWF